MKHLLVKTSHPQTFLAYRYAIGSVAIVLYLLGWVGLLALAGQLLKHQWKEAVPFTIELKETVTEQQAFLFQQQLLGREYIKVGSVHYVSNEEGIQALQADLGRDSLLLFGENPLPDMFQFQLKGSYFSDVQEIVTALQQETPVAQVFYDQNLIATAQQLSYWSWGLLVVVILFLFIAVLLIRHALHWILWSNRHVIATMQLAGASPFLLEYPYRRQGWINGAWSGALALAALLLTAMAISAVWGGELAWWAWWQFWLLLLVLPLVGVGLWAWSMRSTLAHYLHRSPDQWE